VVPQLSWASAKAGQISQLLSHTPLCPGTDALMVGRSYDKVWPNEYFLLRTYSPIVRSALLNLGMSFEHSAPGGRFPIHRVAGGPAIAGPVRLMAAGFFQTHRWLFSDTLGNYSRSSALPGLLVSMSIRRRRSAARVARYSRLVLPRAWIRHWTFSWRCLGKPVDG
jgi:hypothetical protein